MSEIKTEGIILKTTPYQEKHSIISLLTLHYGLLSVFVRHHNKFTQPYLTNPLSQIDLVCTKFKAGSELLSLKEGSMIQNHYFLRSNWSHLECAGQLLSAITYTQLPGKATPHLYLLLSACLKHIPHFADPVTLTTLFYLKLLTHEGLISWEDPLHFPLACSESDWIRLKRLQETRSFKCYYQETGLNLICKMLEKIIQTAL